MKEQEARALAESLGKQLQAMREAGLDAAEISGILTARAKAKGLDVQVKVVPILPGLDGLEVKLNVKDAAELAQSSAAAGKPACPHPHWPCPACQADVCFQGPRPKRPLGVCSSCGAFLHSGGEPLVVRLLTDEEVLALSDDDRINLQRCRRVVEERRQSRS